MNSAERDAPEETTAMSMRLTAKMKMMTLMTMIVKRTTTRRRMMSMTTARKKMQMAKLSIRWTQTMAMNSLMNVLIQLEKTSMRLSGSLILCPNGSSLRLVAASLLQLLLRRSRIAKIARERSSSSVGVVDPNVVLIMRIQETPEDIIDTKPNATRGTLHLLDTTDIATTRTNIMRSSLLLRIDTVITVTIIGQRTSCLTALSIVMVRIPTLCQLSRISKITIMGLIMVF